MFELFHYAAAAVDLHIYWIFPFFGKQILCLSFTG